jgi:hypothetical protein
MQQLLPGLLFRFSAFSWKLEPTSVQCNHANVCLVPGVRRGGGSLQELFGLLSSEQSQWMEGCEAPAWGLQEAPLGHTDEPHAGTVLPSVSSW